ncbi:MAG: IS66 family transposase, partial [bacterium]|nr:IS66 family transposase [bacterium]
MSTARRCTAASPGYAARPRDRPPHGAGQPVKHACCKDTAAAYWEQVDTFVDHFPAACESCWESLPETQDADATRYQFTEVPPVRPHTTEHRRHAVSCPHCRYVTRAAHDKNTIPASPFGPRLMALMAMLTGVYHLSRRKAQSLLSDVLGVEVSLGALSNVEGASATRSSLQSLRCGATSGKPTDRSLGAMADFALEVTRILADGEEEPPLGGAGPLDESASAGDLMKRAVRLASARRFTEALGLAARALSRDEKALGARLFRGRIL